MSNPAYRNAFIDVENHYMKMWKATQPRDTEAREILYLTIQLIQKVKSHIETRVNEGNAFEKFTEKDLKRFGRNTKQPKRSVL